MGKVALFVGRMSQELNNVTWRRIICDIHVYPSILAASSASRTDLRGGFSEFFWREAFWCSSFPSGRAYHARELAVKIPFSHFFLLFSSGLFLFLGQKFRRACPLQETGVTPSVSHHKWGSILSFVFQYDFYWCEKRRVSPPGSSLSELVKFLMMSFHPSAGNE